MFETKNYSLYAAEKLANNNRQQTNDSPLDGYEQLWSNEVVESDATSQEYEW